MNHSLKLVSSPKIVQTQSPVLAQIDAVKLVQENPWLALSSALCIALLGSIVFYRLQIRKVNKRVRFEQYKTKS